MQPRVRRNDYGHLSPPALGAWRPDRSVSVIVPAYQCQHQLDVALAALSRQTYPGRLLEVVVVDDGSSPPLRLPEVRPERCRLVRVPDSAANASGWGRANALRVGVAASEGEILHWLDADLIPYPEHVEAQVRWHQAAPDVVTLGHKLFVRTGDTSVAEVLARAEAGTLADLFPPEDTEPHDYIEALIDATDGLREGDHLAFRAHVGATATVGRALYEQAGGVDPWLRLGEDSELGYRLAQAGAVFVPEPQARSWHLGLSAMMRDGERYRRYNRPFLADRMPHPPWLRQSSGRSYPVPMVVAAVLIGDESRLEQVRDCVDRLLASDPRDLRVLLVADWDALSDDRRSVVDDPLLDRRLIAASYRSDPRVRLVSRVPDSGFPSPYLLVLPDQVGVAPGTVRRVVAEADAARLGLLRVVPNGVSTACLRLWRTAAVSRAQRHRRPGESLAEAVEQVWGAGWASGGGFGLAPLAAPSRGFGGGAGRPVRPVPVAGVRSLARAAGYVGRLAAARAWHNGTHRVVHLTERLRSPSGTTVPTVSRQPAPALAAIRRRVRLRTRLRRTAESWRRAFPRQLPEWTVPAPSHAPVPVLVDPVLVDATAANPRGRERYGPRLPAGVLRVRVDGAGALRWWVERLPDAVTVVAGRAGDRLDAEQAAVLTQLGQVEVPDRDPGAAAAHPIAFAHLLAQLAMTGVVLHVPALLAEVADRLAPPLARLVRAPVPGRRDDPLEWELRSVRQRREAMRYHAAGLRPPPVTAVLVTKRPELMVSAVSRLVDQSYPELEIVVARHNQDGDLPAHLRERANLRMVSVPAERNLGEALAEATRAARGELITKVDDDDRYGPEHIWDLVLARHFSAATVVGKGAELVYLEPKQLTVRRRMAAETFTDTVAGGTLLLHRDDLAGQGGWPPVPRWVDRALLDRTLQEGGDVYRTHPFGFVYTRHGDGHTWDADLDYFVHDALRKWRGLPPFAELGASS